MKKSLLLLYPLFFIILQCSFSSGQVNYNDVAVIVNQNDSVSMAIGNYFMMKRNIPAKNKITIDVPAVEEINDSTFGAMRQQIEDYLTSNHLESVLNYLVTTKGCPLKILRYTNDVNNCNASVESELMLILGSQSFQIGDCSAQSNSFYLASTNFSRILYETYLVTRLDAYTIEEVFRMIDRSGPNRFVNKDSALFVFDQDPAWAAQSLNTELATVTPVLRGRGWQVLLNTDTVFVTHQSNVLGYHSWGSNDSHAAMYSTNAKPQNTWLAGSIAETNVSTGGRSFQPGTAYGQSLIADLIDEGVTCVKGYVYEPYTFAIARPVILWDKYTHLDASGHPLYNMAESYFSASQMVSWMDVVIGDPKTSITTDSAFASLSAKEMTNEHITVFPNPSKNQFTVYGLQLKGTVAIWVFNILGERIYLPQSEIRNLGYPQGQSEISVDISALSPGIYFVQLIAGSQNRMLKVVKE